MLYGASFRAADPRHRSRDAISSSSARNPLVSQGTLVHSGRREGASAADARARAAQVVVIDPRRTETARIATEHQFIRPGTDAFLLLAMVHTIFAEGLQDRAFLAEHVGRTPRGSRSLVAPFTPERAAETTGIDADTIRRLRARVRRRRRARVRSAAPVAAGRFGTLQAWALGSAQRRHRQPRSSRRRGLLRIGLVDMAKIVQMLGLDGYGDAPKPRRRSSRRRSASCRRGVLVDEITTPGQGQIRALGRDGGQSRRLDRRTARSSPTPCASSSARSRSTST